MDLRALRLWHWNEYLRYEKEANSILMGMADNMPVASTDAVRLLAVEKQTHDNASLHIRAVQALNDVVSGTAEEDGK